MDNDEFAGLDVSISETERTRTITAKTPKEQICCNVCCAIFSLIYFALLNGNKNTRRCGLGLGIVALILGISAVGLTCLFWPSIIIAILGTLASVCFLIFGLIYTVSFGIAVDKDRVDDAFEIIAKAKEQNKSMEDVMPKISKDLLLRIDIIEKLNELPYRSKESPTINLINKNLALQYTGLAVEIPIIVTSVTLLTLIFGFDILVLPALTVIAPIVAPVTAILLILSAIKIDKARVEKTLLMIKEFAKKGLPLKDIVKEIPKDLLNREVIQNILKKLKNNISNNPEPAQTIPHNPYVPNNMENNNLPGYPPTYPNYQVIPPAQDFWNNQNQRGHL